MSGGNTDNSNNVNVQAQDNKGNNALVQMGDDDGQGGNFADQSISQSQSSSQNSNVISGGDTTDSGNNVNVRLQSNSRNNAAAQQ